MRRLRDSDFADIRQNIGHFGNDLRLFNLKAYEWLVRHLSESDYGTLKKTQKWASKPEMSIDTSAVLHLLKRLQELFSLS